MSMGLFVWQAIFRAAGPVPDAGTPVPAPTPAPNPAATPAPAQAQAPDPDPAPGVDEFGFQPDSSEHFASEHFDRVVRPKLPRRVQHRGTVGDWPFPSFYYEPEVPGLHGRRVTVDALCEPRTFVWAPTLSHPRVAKMQSAHGQAPCPCGGFGHSTTHQGFT